MTEPLSEKNCIPCKGGMPPLERERRNEMLKELPGWTEVDGHHLLKAYKFTNFAEALDWVNQLGEIAEEEGHHPDFELGWGYVKVKIFTHKIDNLTESDFVLAAKFDRAGI